MTEKAALGVTIKTGGDAKSTWHMFNGSDPQEIKRLMIEFYGLDSALESLSPHRVAVEATLVAQRRVDMSELPVTPTAAPKAAVENWDDTEPVKPVQSELTLVEQGLALTTVEEVRQFYKANILRLSATEKKQLEQHGMKLGKESK